MKKAPTLLIAISFLACKQEDPKQFSHWKINGQEYSSNNVMVNNNTRGSASISSNDNIRFGISFDLGRLPTSGVWSMRSNHPNQDPSFANIGFYLGTTPYGISIHNSNKLTASRVNNKARYTLPSSWFVSNQNPNDSLLIEGIFNEP